MNKGELATRSCLARTALGIVADVAPLWGHTPKAIRRANYDYTERLYLAKSAGFECVANFDGRQQTAACATQYAIQAVFEVRGMLTGN